MTLGHKPARILLVPQTLFATAGALTIELPFLYLRHLGNLELYVVEAIAAALAAGALYFIFLYCFEHAPDSRRGWWLILAAGVLFRFTLWPLAPTLSEDLYRYRWDGRVQVAGYNPYELHPGHPLLQHLREPSIPHFPGGDIRAVYPFLAELTFWGSARLFPSPRAFKIVPASADLLTLFLIAAWLRKRRARNYQLAIYAWNPLVIVEFAGSGHSDALALAALIAAFFLAESRKISSTAALACAALYKSFPVMLFPVWLRRQGWPRSARAWLGILVAIGITVTCAWPYRAALHQIPATMAYYDSRWRNNNASLYAVLLAFSKSHDFAAGIGVGIAAGLALWTAAVKMEPVRAAYLIIGAILMFTPNAYSWYFTWIIPFLCFFPNPAWLLLTVLQFLSYQVLINYQAFGTFEFNHWYVLLTYAPFYAWLLVTWARSKVRPTAQLKGTWVSRPV
jgi:alpha-1,6-mannosyltransferase